MDKNKNKSSGMSENVGENVNLKMNMNYLYNVDYFSPIWEKQDNNQNPFTKKNQQILCYKFSSASPLNSWKNIPGYQSFKLMTSYPGLLIGTGTLHQFGSNDETEMQKGKELPGKTGSLKFFKEDAYKLGFTLDYVYGLPFLPGSSLKGTLKSCFPQKEQTYEEKLLYAEYIFSLLPEESKKCFGSLEPSEKIKLIEELRDNIFEDNDIFLGSYPRLEKESTLFESDYITPHKSPLKNPIPIQILKVRPGIPFEFFFVLHDFCAGHGGAKQEDGSEVGNQQSVFSISAEQKLNLFKACILDVGIGAKTNVGYGNMLEVTES